MSEENFLSPFKKSNEMICESFKKRFYMTLGAAKVSNEDDSFNENLDFMGSFYPIILRLLKDSIEEVEEHFSEIIEEFKKDEGAKNDFIKFCEEGLKGL